MSFAKRVKEELVHVELNNCCIQSELSAIIHLAGEMKLNSQGKFLEFQTNSADIARRFYMLVKMAFKAQATVMTKKQLNLYKKTFYIVQVNDHIDEILQKTMYFAFDEQKKYLALSEDCCKKAYLRGAFLASGSINNPSSANYHLEIAGFNSTDSLFVQRLFNDYEMNARVIKRRDTLIVYLKNMNTIIDFLRIIGALNSAFYFEGVVIERKLKSNIRGYINCELANEVKTINACNAQLADIQIIEKANRQDFFDDKFLKIVDARKKYPTYNLVQLSDVLLNEYQLRITKSGLSHRFVKLKEFAEKIKPK